MFVNSLIPPYFSIDPAEQELPRIPLQTPSQVIDRGSKAAESGFFSAFTSYISSYAADDPPEPSEEELESTLIFTSVVEECNIGHIFNNML